MLLGAGDFPFPFLCPGVGQTLPIGLFIGYFPTQRTGVTIHSPKNCLPGAGWTFESSQYVNLNDANGKAHRVGEYIISRRGATGSSLSIGIRRMDAASPMNTWPRCIWWPTQCGLIAPMARWFA